MNYSAESAVQRARRLAPQLHDSPNLREQQSPDEAIYWLRDAGLLTVALRERYGGLGLGIEPARMLPLLQILQALGYGDLSIGRIYEGHVNALRLLQTFGTAQQIDRFAAAVHAGHLFGIWNTGFGDDVTFEPQAGGRVRLHGAKVFASGATCVTRPFVNGTWPDGGWRMAIVPLDEHAVAVDPSWWQPLGMQASVSYRVSFEGVVIDGDSLIGPAGAYQQQPWLSGGAIRFAAVQLGGAERLVDITRRDLQRRTRTDHPFQQQRLAKMALAVESGQLWLAGAARQAECADEQPDQFVNYVGLARTAIEQICLDVMQLAQQSIGVQGMLQPHPLERLLRDLTTYLRQPNPDGALVAAGRAILDDERPFSALWKV